MPYCRRKCPYCDFYKKVPRTGERERFVQALTEEMPLAADAYDWAAGPPTTVYFGGGTPSLHTADEIKLLLSTVREVWGEANPKSQFPNPTQIPSSLAPPLKQGGNDIEITLETNPGTVDGEKLLALRDAGINRLSIGAQSFSSRKLAMLYRDHTAEETRECVQMARDAGFLNLSLDLIFGLPGETLEEWKEDIQQALSLRPDHVSLYNLEFHEGTVFDRWRKRGRLSPLDEDLEAEMYLMTHEMITRNGLEHYEVSNFARPGFRSVHNSAYWKGRPYLGLGPSAHSFDGEKLRFQNVADIHEYFLAIGENRIPVANSELQGEEVRKEDWIALQLRKCEGIRFEEAVRELGESETQELWERAKRLPENSRTLTENQFSLTPEGWFRENEVLLWIAETMSDGFTDHTRIRQ